MVSDRFVEQAHRELYDILPSRENRYIAYNDLIQTETRDEFCQRLEAEGFFAGACAMALVFKSWVLKWTKENDPFHADAGSANDEELYWRVANQFPQYLENFAMTQALDSMFTLQERIIPAADVVDHYALLDGREPRKGPTYQQVTEALKLLIDISFALGVGDLHSGNWGYRVDDVEFKTPVIFDFSRTEFNPVSRSMVPKEIVWGINLSLYDDEQRQEIYNYIAEKYCDSGEKQVMESEDDEVPSVSTSSCSCSFCKFDRNSPDSGSESDDELF